MKKYIIAIEETVSDEFEVYAENDNQAMEIATEKYNSSEFILAPGKLCAKRMATLFPDDAVTEWVEF